MKSFMRRRTLVAAMAVAGLLVGAVGSSAGARQSQSAPLKGVGKGLKIIGNVGYSSGSDMEFATIKGRDYAFAGSFAPLKDGGGLHVIDITNPEKVKEVAWLKCTVYQSDIQISHDQKTLLMGADSAGGPEACLATGKAGFMTVDITNPKAPKAIGMATIARGSHNITAHPSKPYVYNSDSDLGRLGQIEIWSIKNPAKPTLVNTVPTIGGSPHDISFDKKGNRIVTAGIDNVEIFDTTDPENPSLKMTFQCPGCSITHDAKFTPDDKGLVIGDEGGGGGTYPCPGGALYFYRLEADFVPVLTGIYEPGEVVIAGLGSGSQGGPGGCTSHVFDFDDKGEHISISWYTAGTRYLRIGDRTGAAFGERNAGNIVEAGWFRPDGGSSWSSKIYKDPKYIFSNDIQRGFDVFKVEG
ncbi:MAG: LVIVD repeat-containing protein [Actinomycetota bacterium]